MMGGVILFAGIIVFMLARSDLNNYRGSLKRIKWKAGIGLVATIIGYVLIQ